MTQATPASLLTIFGATGDLSRRMLLPSLYSLQAEHLLPDGMRILGTARSELSREAFAQMVADSIHERIPAAECNDEALHGLIERLDFFSASADNDVSMKALADKITSSRNGDALYHMSTAPKFYGPACQALAAHGAAGPGTRVMLEKPIGTDLASAIAINDAVAKAFDEERIYRTDHYLGKEGVQNLIALRFGNSLFEPLWSARHIEQVQITVGETVGVEGRGDYYDESGALRDMLQNHLMQLLTIVAMEPPAALEADALHDEKVKVMRSIRPIAKRAVHAHAVRAQYARGTIDGRNVPGYQQEENVEPNSVTETYVAAKFYIDNWRWRGVPFYLRTGKRMAQQSSMIALRFRHPPQQLFRETPLETIDPNWILLSIQPDESMRMEIHVKQPGLDMDTRLMQLNASFLKTDEQALDAYEALLLDVIEGDRSLFLRFDEVEWAWRVVDPILKNWAVEREYIPAYPAGSWGPAEANRLFDSDDQTWRNEL